MLVWLSAAIARASARETFGERLAGDFDRDVAAEARIVGAIDLAHPACP